MRRKDREVPIGEIAQIIDKCDVCRLAFADNNVPYIVPMNFGYDFEEETLVLYFHCAMTGKKLDMLEKNNQVCFEMDCSHQLITGERACDYSFAYESVIGSGIMEKITDKEDKIHGLNILMQHYSDLSVFQYAEKYVDAVAVLKLTVKEYAGKRRAG